MLTLKRSTWAIIGFAGAVAAIIVATLLLVGAPTGSATGSQSGPDYAGYDKAVQALGYTDQLVNRSTYADHICASERDNPGHAVELITADTNGATSYSTAASIAANAKLFVCDR